MAKVLVCNHPCIFTSIFFSFNKLSFLLKKKKEGKIIVLKLRKNKRRSHYIILSLSIRSDKPNSVDEIDVRFHLKKLII